MKWVKCLVDFYPNRFYAEPETGGGNEQRIFSWIL